MSIRKSCKVHTKLTPEREGGTTESVTRPQTWNLLSDVTCNNCINTHRHTYSTHTGTIADAELVTKTFGACMHTSTLQPTGQTH